jgi:hypothetical protein
MDGIELWQLGLGVALFLAGLGVGFVLRRGDASLRSRIQVLESEVAEAERRYSDQQARVEKHFEKTSDLFRDLTEHYTALYGHLAEGARTLCPEGGPALGKGLNDPLLEAGLLPGAEARAALSDLEPLDDLEDLPASAASDADDDLDLDEAPPGETRAKAS